MYNADAHPRVVSRDKTAEQVANDFATQIQPFVENNCVTQDGFVQFYLDSSCTMPSDREAYFQQMMMAVWGLKNAADDGDVRSSAYVPTVRLNQIEDIIYEKIRQKTHKTNDDGITIRKLFRHFDMTGFGTVTIKEFTQVLETLGCIFTEKEMSALFNKYDKDQSGKMDYEEFAGLVANKGAGSNPNVKNQFRTQRQVPLSVLEKIKTTLRGKGMMGMKSLVRLF